MPELRPQKGGQEQYFTRTEYEVLFGGHAGPGKTWALMVDAGGFQFKGTIGKAAIGFADYRAVVFRRKTTELTKMIDEGRKMYENSSFRGEYVQGRRGDPGPSFTFPSGAKIFCCHLQHEDDKTNHHGLEYQFIGFDELTTFTFTQYLYLFHRCRSTIPGLWARIRSTTNPVGPGLTWVKKRFIKNGGLVLEPCKKYYFAPDLTINDPYQNPTGIMANEYVKEAKSRTFIPGFIEENKYLQDIDGYKASVMQMGKKYGMALIDGDWDAFSGDFFDDFGKWCAVKPFVIPKHWKLIGSLDPGWSSPCSFGLTAVDTRGGLWRLFTYYVSGKSITQHVSDIYMYIKGFQHSGGRLPEYIVCGHDAFPAGPDKDKIHGERVYFANELQNVGLTAIKATTARVPGWWAWKDAMRRKLWHYFEGYNNNLVEEIVAAQHDESDPEDILGRGNDSNVYDHALDENRYGVMAAYKPVKPKEVDPFSGRPQWGKPVEIPSQKDPRVIWGSNER